MLKLILILGVVLGGALVAQDEKCPSCPQPKPKAHLV